MIRKIVIQRVAIGILVLWLVSVLVFISIHLLPGNAANNILPKDTEPDTLAALTKELGLDKPLLSQYWHWVTGLVTGDWGDSLVSTLSVSSIVQTHLTTTFVLTLLAMLFTAPLAIVIGTLSAMRNGGPADNAVSVGTLTLSSLPAFVIGILVIHFLATNVFHVLPAASIIDPERSIWSQLHLAIVPTIAVVLTSVTYPIRMVRASMIDVLQSDYVMMARLKGLPERQVVFRHALRNGLAPMVQALGLTLMHLSGGVIIIETVFSFPGIGYALIQAVNQRDIPVVQTVVVLLAAACVAINLLADLTVIWLTPRLRTRL